MTYYIQQITSTANLINYWTYVLDSNGNEFSTTDLVILENKLLETEETIPRSKLQVVTKVDYTNDIIFP